MVQTVLAGQVIGVRKRGDAQAFVQLEDGRGRIECGFFAEQWNEFAPLLTRDQILVVEGGLREDEFNGGYSLRVSRCWDFTQLCNQQAQRIAFRIDLRQPQAMAQLQDLLTRYAGTTPVVLDAITAAGVGRLHLHGEHGLRVDASLPGKLRSLPGVSAVNVTLARPWATPKPDSQG
jgi:DNA polymerase-3 subunit alpha